jgi:hypothetical protein
VEGTNQPTNQTTKELNEGRDLHKSASRRPSTSLAIPALTASLGSITDTLICNCDCAYANEFPVAVEDLDIGKLWTFAQEAIGFKRGRYFGWKAVWDSNPDWFEFYLSL